MSIVGEYEIKAEKIERNRMEITIKDANVDIRRNNGLTVCFFFPISLIFQKKKKNSAVAVSKHK